MSKINEKLIVYESSPDFSDNPRGLYEYVKENTDYLSFWIIKDKNMMELLRENGVSCALKGSEEADEAIRSAKYLVSASFEFAYEKRPGQIHVSAWHGFPLKLIGFFDSAAGNESAFFDLKIITTQSDIITASSKLSQLTIAGMFAVDPRKVKDIGFPRNDIMLRENARINLKKITDVDIENSKLIFYLPTMRKGLKKEGAQFDKNIFNYSDYDVKALDDFLERHNAYIFAKVHFADNEYYKKNNFALPKRLIFLDTEKLNYHFLTIYHIMDAFDVLLTDYSSVYADFLLLNKPIIFSCPDIDIYKTDRGFVIDDPTLMMPGAIVKTQKELLMSLRELCCGKDNYISERKSQLPIFHRYRDSDAGKRLFQEMIKASEQGIQDSTRQLVNYFGNTSIYSYGLEGSYEVFFDTGNGFNEKEKYCGHYIVEKDELIIIEINLPEDTQFVRFDPDDTMRCFLKDFRVFVDEEVTEYSIVNGKEVDGEIVFTEIDPQIIIPIENGMRTIKIEYQCLDLLAFAGQRLIKKEVELANMRNSSSWKITKPLRKIKSKLGHVGTNK